MDKAVTISGVLTSILVIVGFVGLVAGLLFVLDLMNPFRSGH